MGSASVSPSPAVHDEDEMSERTNKTGEVSRRHVVANGGVAAALAAIGAGLASRTAGAQEGTPVAAENPNVQVIMDYYAAYALGDPEALRPFFADDIVWRIPGRGPLAGAKRGADEVLAFFSQLAKGGFQAEPVVLAAADDWVIDLHRGWSTEGEGQVDILWALAFRIEDGRIAEAVNFAFDQYAADAYWWANYPLKPIPERLADA